MKMQEAIMEALRRLNYVPDSRMLDGIENSLGPGLLAIVIPEGREERTIRALMYGMLDGTYDNEHRSFSA